MDIGSARRPDPVFYRQPRDPGKLLFIVGYKNDPERAGVRGNPEIIVSYQAPGALQLAPNLSVVLSNTRLECQNWNEG